MSFILDALRKSDTERQQHQSAEFASVAIGRSSTAGPRWIWLVGILLAINIAVLVGLFMREDIDVSVAGIRSIPNNATAQNQVESTTAEPSFAEKAAAARGNGSALAQAESASDYDTVVENRPATARVVLQNPGDAGSTATYPTIHTVRANGAITLAELHLDIHVYSDAAEDRFVFINMSKHREGSQLDEGPVVHEITTDGVVLGHEGLFFLLPRD